MNHLRTAGSYYRNDLYRSVSGLGDDASLSAADQAMLALVQYTPSVIYTEWASLAGDVTWTEELPTTNYQAFAIVDAQVASAAQSATVLPATLAIIAPALTYSTSIDSALEGTPYAYEKTEAVYSQIDPREPPQIFFLYWLSAREATDPSSGSNSLNAAASSVGGVLCYVVDSLVGAAASTRARPSTPFGAALAAQQASGPISIPMTPAQASTLPIPSSIPGLPAIPGMPTTMPGLSTQSASSSAPVVAITSNTTKAVLIVTLGVVAAVGAYKLFAGRSA